MIDPARLAGLLRGLRVEVESVEVVRGRAVQPGWPDGRPTSELVLEGLGHTGRGEHVGFTDADHDAFVDWSWSDPPLGDGTVGDLVCGEGHLRCAVEGALIDLALRQAGRAFEQVAGGGGTPVHTWISFDVCADPGDRARRILANVPRARFKIDVDPDWPGSAWDGLVGVPVDVLDFKGRGDLRTVGDARLRLPRALLEDPPVAHGRVGRDQGVRTPEDARVAPGESVNLKGPRMGGWLALLEAAAIARSRGTPVYVGGMSEAGVGRGQARRLASLLAPDVHHDLAPIPPIDDAPRDVRPRPPDGTGY